MTGGLERRCQLVGARLDGLRNCHDEPPVAIYDVSRVDDRQPNNAVAAGSEAKDVPLGRLLAFARLWWTDV